VPDLDTAKGHLEVAKKNLAITMCPGSGELVKYSEGQFIEGFLHPALRPAFALFRIGDTKAAVSTAFFQREHYVSIASGISQLPLLHLMQTVFKPGDGVLSNGPNPQGDHLESSTQLRMRDLFTGSPYVRNLYGHSPPKTSFDEAVTLLMLARYLYRLVDSQLVKRGKPPAAI